MTSRRCRRGGRQLLGAAAAIAWAAYAAAAGPASSEEFLYHAAARDTLIGIGRRLLIEPRRWHELQLRNRIADPRHIPLGQILRIPYGWLKLNAEAATVVGIGGQVDLAGKKLAIGDLLPQGSVIRTGPDGSVTLDLADGSVITLQKSSVLRLEEMVQVAGVSAARSIVLKLDAGRVESAVKAHRDVGRFEIITPVAVSAVRGTQFRDSYADDDAHGTTETLEGTVGVGNGGTPVAVAAGFGTRIEPDREPLPPVMLLPAPDLSQLPAGNGGGTLIVRWGPVSGARQYRVQLAADPQFHAVTADRVTVEPSLELPAPPDGAYWLRARSIDGFGIEGPDAVRSVAQHLLPAAPRLTSPDADAKIVGNTVHLAWSPAADAALYVLQVAAERSFGVPVVDRQDLRSPDADLTSLPPGRYFWRAKSVDTRGEAGPWSSVQTFSQRPTMATPEAKLERRQVAFHWRPTPGETVRLQVAGDPGFEHPVVDRQVEADGWSMPKPFPGIYYCRAQSVDADGSGGAFSAPRRFVVPIPLWMKVGAPLAIGLAFLL